ncbi:hypothetical protein, conserved [Trypanosoma brucei gambiense DAL972]|uniref:Uncharacterized protein n=2 Tax=Trypanosoma brucei TaxID=5691 RepID=C9ZRK4_TRYB9|nr:hypothetical protein, conserved [Trypanosoma brucei gambiense DAL972]RHW71747.1 hypothetical protein DPX39_070032600 [Trypanosoma brucei equiperdum]CBH12306.1 hypothetical protein, conserved [Trypanosoma brucei gambiense DAL972]|eukprot:XP_011774587.1 hypothetical protein, conserved [Trypanosoma brucei gambiense DAL972]
MYRPRGGAKQDRKESAASRKADHSGSQTSDATSSDVSFVNSIVGLKTRLLTPFMKYDKTLKQVVINPEHDRVFRSEVSRVQGVVLRELRRILEFDSRLTPKEALYLVQKSVMLAFASCAVGSDGEVLVPCGSDEEAEVFMPRLEKIFAERSACAKAVVSLTAVLCTGVVRDNYGVVCQRLEARLAAEEASPANSRRTDVELQALAATKKNTQDFLQFRAALVTAFDSISAPLTSNGSNSIPRETAAADGTTANLVVQSFYSLLGWMLMVQPDRLNLETTRITPSLPFSPQDISDPPVTVTYYDPSSGKITIERSASSFKWGLLINMASKLIGVENTLRTATSTGGELFHALQLSEGGLPIYNINGVTIREPGEQEADGDVSEEVRVSRLEKLQNILKSKVTKVSLLVAGVSGMHDPQEVSFNIIPQGGEGASGQEACLILKRPSVSVDWKLKLVANGENQLILDSVSPNISLSNAASEFINTHLGNLHVAQVNGCEPKNNSFLDDVMRSSLFLILRLQTVATVNSDSKDGSVAVGVGNSRRQPKATEIEKLEGAELAERGGSKSNVMRSAADDEIKNAGNLDSQHRHGTDSDRPLPEGQGTREQGDEETQHEGSEKTEPKKRGRRRKTPHSSETDDRTAETSGEVRSSTVATMETKKVGTTEGEEKGEATKKRKAEKKASEKKKKDKEDARKKAGKKLSKAAKKSGKEKKGGKTKKGKDKEEGEEKRTRGRKSNKAKDSESKDGEAKEETHEGGKKADSGAGTSLKEAAEAQGVVDKPLVDVKPRSDAAVVVSRKSESKKESSSSTSPGGGDAAAVRIAVAPKGSVAMTPEVMAELKEAPPLTFENAVTLDHFDGMNMELRRPDLKTSWDISMTHGGDKLVLTRLPPVSAALKTHPFMKTLVPDDAGQISWQVDGVNGIDLHNATKSIRLQAMDSIKKSSKVSLILRQLIK